MAHLLYLDTPIDCEGKSLVSFRFPILHANNSRRYPFHLSVHDKMHSLIILSGLNQ